MLRHRSVPVFADATATAVVAIGLLISRAALADVTYTLDTFTGAENLPPPGAYGIVDLHQNGANTDVTVTLTGGEGFVRTGAGAALTWDLAGEPVVAIAHLDLSKFAFSKDGTTTGNLDGTGNWFYEIDCSAAACGSGGSNPYPGPLTFTIDNVTPGDFIINNKTSTGYIFASDICTQIGSNGRCAGTTGDVAASFAATAPIPEPGMLAVLGTAMLSLGLFRRRNR